MTWLSPVQSVRFGSKADITLRDAPPGLTSAAVHKLPAEPGRGGRPTYPR